MTRVRLTAGVIEDFDRIVSHLQGHEVDGVDARADVIISALDILAGNPLIGRPAGGDKRELVIGRGSHGYLALYRYVALIDMVLILAVRAQREGSYAHR